jgi:hypothetical protein
MAAIVQLQLSFESLVEAIASLNLDEKRQLQEVIEQQIFEAKEVLYEDDPETLAEIAAVREEIAAGNYISMKSFEFAR